MRAPRTVLSRRGNMNPRFTSRLQEALDRIAEPGDPEEIRKATLALGEIHNADLIIEGQDPTYAVCEISITVERQTWKERSSAPRRWTG